MLMDGKFCFILLVCFVFFVSFVVAENPSYIEDSLGRVVNVDFSDNSLDIVYEYYGDSGIISSVIVGDGLEVYSYDTYGNILSQVYSDDSENNRWYVYDYSSQNVTLKKIYKMGSIILLDYYPDGNLKSETVFNDGVSLTVRYEYDSNNNVATLTGLSKRINRVYDGSSRLINEAVEMLVEGGSYKTIQNVTYFYDIYSNLIKMTDSTGISIEWTYEPYSCMETVCISRGCTQDSCFQMSDCDSAGVCVPYDCSVAEEVQSTCSALVGKKINNYAINFTGEGDVEKYKGSTWEDEYLPGYTYDSSGCLNGSDNADYQYIDDECYFLDEATVNNYLPDDDFVFDSNYDENTYVKTNTNLDSSIVNANEIYSYDALDRVVKEEVVEEGTSSGSPVTASVIKNFFTGLGIFDWFGGSSSKVSAVYYLSIPGDESSAITKEEYAELVKPENIWPELQEYYVGVVDGNGNLNESWLQTTCRDSDAELDSYFVFGNVESGNVNYERMPPRIYYDYCKNENTLVEYYCGTYWFGFGKIITLSKEVDCEYGCNAGACLSAPLNIVEVSCFNGIMDGNETGIDCGGNCEECKELPPDSKLPDDLS